MYKYEDTYKYKYIMHKYNHTHEYPLGFFLSLLLFYLATVSFAYLCGWVGIAFGPSEQTST